MHVHITQQLHENNKIPYKLLLLADESIEAINKYINRAPETICGSCGKE